MLSLFRGTGPAFRVSRVKDMASEDKAPNMSTDREVPKLLKAGKGFDTVTWGHATWELLLTAAHAADHDASVYPHAVQFFQLQTLATPCDPCSEFYAFLIASMSRMLSQRRVLLVPQVFRMRAIVDAKIQGSLGTESAYASLIQHSNTYQVMKRLDVTGTLISSTQACEQFMLRAARIGTVKAEGRMKGSDLQLATQSLLYSMLAFGACAKSLGRVQFAHRLKKNVLCALRSSDLDWKAAYAAAHRTATELEDGVREDMASCLSRHMRASQTLVEWATECRS